jgi:putative transposase
MSTFTQILYQIIFSTKSRKPTLIKEHRPELFKGMTGILNNKKCHLYRINGVEDHLHIVTHLHPSVALADLIKDLKLGSRSLIKEKGIFPEFDGWQTGYSAFTYSIEAKDNLIEYVKNQEEHHRRETYLEELKRLLQEHQVDFDERYLE